MITKKELQEIAKLKGMNLGNAEKDYLIDIALLSISKHTKNELVFKGGTCLYKFHKLDRFSEDLDFSAVQEIDAGKLMQNVISDFEKFGIKASLHEKSEPYNSILITLRLQGPLFTGSPMSYANIGIDINIKSSVIMPAEVLLYQSIYPEIPTVQALCMSQEEIFAEKIRAVMTRKRARDLFDLHFLLKEKIKAERGLIDNKMGYYNQKFDINHLILKIKELKLHWKKELTGFTHSFPDFNDVHKETAQMLKKLYA